MKPSDRTPSRRRAAALRYDPGQDVAPRLVAKGQGLVAERILDLAHRHDVPVHEDPALVDVLSRLDLEQQIPVELYLVVARILAFLSRAQASAASRTTVAGPSKDTRSS